MRRSGVVADHGRRADDDAGAAALEIQAAFRIEMTKYANLRPYGEECDFEKNL